MDLKLCRFCIGRCDSLHQWHAASAHQKTRNNCCASSVCSKHKTKSNKVCLNHVQVFDPTRPSIEPKRRTDTWQTRTTLRYARIWTDILYDMGDKWKKLTAQFVVSLLASLLISISATLRQFGFSRLSITHSRRIAGSEGYRSSARKACFFSCM